MAIKKDLQSPRKGMNRDSAPFELQKEEYSFALNANFQDEHGNGAVVIQNEPSNVKCSGFKDGFKVVGHKYYVNQDKTFFFLFNPTTNVSEIGSISSFYDNQGLSPVEQTIDGDVTVVLETPLELQPQVAICNYTTIISDYCELTETATGCLNFSLDFPIKENNIHIKEEKTGIVMYFTDNNNPQRYLQLDRLHIYTQDEDDCEGTVAQTCFQCDKLRVFPLHNKPCLRPRVIQNGGNLSAGTYEVTIAACDISGNELTDYYGTTNPIPIFDKNNLILDQTLLGYQTSQAIAIDVIDFDQRFEYYKIVVMYRSGLDGSVGVYENGIYPADQTSVTVYTIIDKPKGSLTDIVNRRAYYTKARGLAESNGYLFHYGLTQRREINLQPIFNLLGGFARWMTVQAAEDLYEDGIFVSNYQGYFRDEVYPWGIKLFMDGGYELPLNTLIPRPPTSFELDVLGTGAFPTNTNTNSVLANNPTCSEDIRNRRWQFENTATIEEGICTVPTTGFNSTTEVREIESECVITDINGQTVILDTIASSSFEYEGEQSIVNYINSHIQEIIDSVAANGADIRDILEDPSEYLDSCEPDFGDNCSEDIELIEEQMFAVSVDSEDIAFIPKDYSDYERVAAPLTCQIYTLDSGGDIEEDTSFQTSFMNPGEVVYRRFPLPTNTSCSSAQVLQPLLNPQIPNYNYLINKGQVGAYNTLQTTSIASTTEVIYDLTLIGAAGTADIIVNGITYVATFASDLATTAFNFATVNAGAILIDTGVTLTSVGDTLRFEGEFVGFPTITITTTTFTLDGEYDRSMFTDKIHSNAIWYKANFLGATSLIAEMSATLCDNPDDNSSNKIRVSVFSACPTVSDIPIYSRIIDDVTQINDINKFLELNASDFGGTSSDLYIAIDSPIRTRLVSATVVNTLTPSCGCFSIYQRTAETNRQVNYTNLTFGKRQKYRTQCSFEVVLPNECDPVPFQKGKFSYWESIERYPCNDELFDSSNLVIPVDSIPLEFRAEFEEYYVDAIVANNYVLSSEANFMDKPIRHYKFPCSTIVPFMTSTDPGPFNQSMIYPIGFFLSNTIINAFLDIAVLNGLLSQEERNSINKYEVFRGDRRVDKSIIAKGLLFDMFQYEEENGDKVHYPNYPLNSLGIDGFNNVLHPYNSLGNKLFSFHSPEIHFEKPTLPREMKVEGYQFGKSSNYFDEVKGHSTYTILGNGAYAVATTLAIAEIAFDIAVQVSTWAIDSAGTAAVSFGGSLIASALAIAALTVSSAFKFGQYQMKWVNIFYGVGKPQNFAYYQASIGHYNFFQPNSVANSLLRGISVASYLPAGRWNVPDEVTLEKYNINKVDREDSVFLSLGLDAYNILYPANYINYDNQLSNPATASRTTYQGTGRSGNIVRNAASPYVSLKEYLPGQYGSITSVVWINTGFCGDLNSALDCDPIFGGDAYISRFAVKRKLPFFTTDAFNQAPLTPFKYSDYFNINPPAVDATAAQLLPRLYIDYQIDADESTLGSLFMPSQKSRFNLDPAPSNLAFYVKPPSKFYLYSYGIPHFLVESEINCNYRYAKREAHENFYPNVGDVIDWTQEKNVSIKETNKYFYNTVYSQGHSFYPYRTLPINYSEELYGKINDLTNSVIYSMQDVSQNSLSDPWLIYKALDFYDFEKAFGKLIDMDGIESEQILARFTNGMSIFGAIDVLRDRVTPETKNLGQGGIFAGRTVNFNKTELGYAGTQHSVKISCEFGHFWVDAKRGKVFQLAPNGQGLEEISRSSDSINSGCEKWFKENLPFKILGYTTGLTEEDLDNTYKGIGISMGWDDRLKRVFITKKDYIPLANVCYSNNRFYDNGVDSYSATIMQYETAGWTFTGFDSCRLRFEFTDEDEGVTEMFLTATEVRLGDLNYFQDCSFTVAYSPMLKAWISYYSFKPDYYISFNDYFQTGLNFPQDSNEFGLWSHLPFMSSYQVFYGKRYPFIIEYPLSTQMSNSILHTIEYYLDVRKYYNKHNFANKVGTAFNKAIVYNDHQNSGLLNLTVQIDDDMRQNLNFPQHNINSIDILQTEINQKHSFNYLYNMIRNERSGLPIWSYDCAQVEKTLDDRLLDYRYTMKDRLRGDYFLVRLINDIESRFKYLFRFSISERNFYDQ